MNAEVILENVTLGYERQPAVHHISGCFAGGSLTAVTGPNGAGKSTLLKGIAGILRPQTGQIILKNAAYKDIAYLPQAVDIQHEFPISVMQMVSTGLWNKTNSLGAIDKPCREKIHTALEATGLRGFEQRQLGGLSAGQFQRALFARLLLQDAKIILLDEPFSAVDADTTVRLLDMVKRWHTEGRTIICVIHDQSQIEQFFPQCLLLARDCVAWGPVKDALKPELLHNTRLFRESWQIEAGVCEQ